jgi:hypothetical protein
MSVALVVRAMETSGYQTDAPTRAEITDALRRVVGQSYTNAQGAQSIRLGNWAGPAPRVTRWANPINNKTYATWVFLVPGDTLADGFVQRLSDDVAASLGQHASHHMLLGSAWEVQVAPYNEAINGPPAWWESSGPDSASRAARYVDTWPPVDAQVIPGATMPIEDNHDGPNDLHPVPTESNPLLWITILTGVVVAGVALVEFGPAITAWSRRSAESHAAKKAAPQPKSNPRRRR